MRDDARVGLQVAVHAVRGVLRDGDPDLGQSRLPLLARHLFPLDEEKRREEGKAEDGDDDLLRAYGHQCSTRASQTVKPIMTRTAKIPT